MQLTAINTIVYDGGVAAPGEEFVVDVAEGERLVEIGAAARSTEPASEEPADKAQTEGKGRKTRAKRDQSLDPEAGEGAE